jgi:hypothetical protein
MKGKKKGREEAENSVLKNERNYRRDEDNTEKRAEKTSRVRRRNAMKGDMKRTVTSKK